MDEIRTRSTSRVTAQASDVVLRETSTTRLIFRPIILDNQNNLGASVKGHFLFQRKSRSTQWSDFETIPLSSIKSGEGYKLELKSEELLSFFREVESLYEIHRQAGVPRGDHRFIRSTPQLEQLAKLTARDISKFLRSNDLIFPHHIGHRVKLSSRIPSGSDAQSQSVFSADYNTFRCIQRYWIGPCAELRTARGEPVPLLACGKSSP